MFLGETKSRTFLRIYFSHIIQICSGITRGRVFNRELFGTEITEVKISTFVYILFHEDFSPISPNYQMERELKITIKLLLYKYS